MFHQKKVIVYLLLFLKYSECLLSTINCNGDVLEKRGDRESRGGDTRIHDLDFPVAHELGQWNLQGAEGVRDLVIAVIEYIEGNEDALSILRLMEENPDLPVDVVLKFHFTSASNPESAHPYIESLIANGDINLQDLLVKWFCVMGRLSDDLKTEALAADLDAVSEKLSNLKSFDVLIRFCKDSHNDSYFVYMIIKPGQRLAIDPFLSSDMPPS